MKIGVLFIDSHGPNTNYRYPENGNPGIGGTQYCFLMLMRYLSLYYSDILIKCFHIGKQFFPERVESVELKSSEEIFKYDLSDLDIFIFRCNGGGECWYKQLEKIKINCIAWAHNDLSVNELEMLYSIDNIKRVVCVGKQQYDRLIDHKIVSKLTFIYSLLATW